MPEIMTGAGENARWLQRLRDLRICVKFRFRHILPVGFFLLGVLVTAPSIWSEASFTDKDEYWRTFRTPLEMLGHRSYLTPWLNGEPRLVKPPLTSSTGLSLARTSCWE
jgi:hypothetical protein